MIIGIGVDVVDLDKFASTVERTPRLLDRLFTPAERGARSESLAATFGAKEAVAKVLGAPPGLRWHDCEITHDDAGRPFVVVTGTVAAAASSRGIERWHVSLSHDGGTAIAMVIGEGEDR